MYSIRSRLHPDVGTTLSQVGRQRVEWTDDSGAWVTSVQELDSLLDDLTQAARAKPFMAELTSNAGDSLAIGLGLDESVASWVSAGGAPPYFASEGDPEADGMIVFFYRGHWSEFPRSSAVPTERAREVLRDFFRHGRRPANFRWVEV